MARWITVTKPFEFRWPDRSFTVFQLRDLGEHMVKDELADFAVAGSYATEGKAEGSTTKSAKGGPKARTTRRAKRAKVTTDAKANATDRGSDPKLVRTDRPDDDRAGDRAGAVDKASG